MRDMILRTAINKKGMLDKPSQLRKSLSLPTNLGSDRIAEIDTPTIAPNIQKAVKKQIFDYSYKNVI